MVEYQDWSRKYAAVVMKDDKAVVIGSYVYVYPEPDRPAASALAVFNDYALALEGNLVGDYTSYTKGIRGAR